MSRLGAKIKDLRIQKGMTHKQLGRAIGVAENFMIEVESGKKVLNDDLIKRLCKALDQDVFEFMEIAPVDETPPVKDTPKVLKKADKPETGKKEVQQVWDDAFGSILKTIPLYEYDLNTVIGTRQLPIVSNKVEGFQKDKVIYLKIMDNDMIGFRMTRDDLAFAHLTNEIENNTICLVEYNDQRVIRQIRKLDRDKVLLVSNNGKLITETATVKDIKVLARLVRLEIKL